MKSTVLLSLFALGSLTAAAQYVPSHPKYITYIADGKSFIEYFPTWEPGKALSEDENFFISRVRLKERFVNRNTQVVPDNDHNNRRKFSLCTPMGISDTYWQTLPRGVMDGDNFGMWSYIDYQDGWSQSWIRNVGAYADVCHKNGVQNSGGVIFIDETGNGGNNTGAKNTIKMLTEKNADGSWKYLDKFCKFLRYYGVDGVTFNPEGFVPNAALLQDFLADVHERADKEGWKFHVCWYGTSTNEGNLSFTSALSADKANWFIKNGRDVCDVYFLNYEWTNAASSSVRTAENLREGAASNLFASYDIQANWLGRGRWTTLENNDMSIVFWGNHTTDMIYQNSTELGSTDEAVQYNYLTKQEQVFSGGNRNPAATPGIRNGVTVSSTEGMKDFHGIAALMPARSALQELPFITRFSLGNGKVFRCEGEETFRNKWYSLSSQDYLPTWRWWITDETGKVPADAVSCGFTFDDSWYAGSCMTISGQSTRSNIRLFKTNFNVSASDAVNLVFKLKEGNNSHARLFWSFVGSEDQLHYAEITGGNRSQWTEWQKSAEEIGMTGQVALLGLSYSDTPANYEMLVGELGIVPQHSYQPVQPVITHGELLERTYNNVSYKLIWDCKAPADRSQEAFLPTYNDEVDTWYYEVYSQAKDPDTGKALPMTLDGVTTSWAHYIVGAWADADITDYRFGVRAVAPDGKTASEITWTEWMTAPATQVEGISLDRPVIKPGETFTLAYTDPLHAAAAKWQIVDSSTGEDAITPQVGGTSVKAAISHIGSYDVILTPAQGEPKTYRGFVQITGTETGAVPAVTDLKADSPILTAEQPETRVAFQGLNLGKGKVSRGLKMSDANQFCIPAEALPQSQAQYSIGFWVKPDMFAHSKYGTNLINQRSIANKWPHNNWGALWVIVWPQQLDGNKVALDENVISYTLYQTDPYNRAIAGTSNSNIHETPFYGCTTDRHLTAGETYALNPGTWSHVMVTYDGTTQRIYFNGKCAASARTPRTAYNKEAPIYIGGSNVYHAGIVGTIDDVQVWHKALSETEVQTAMTGFEDKDVPAELMAYYTFEETDANQQFSNLGHGGSSLKGAYVALSGSAGENTSGTYEEILTPDTDVLGNPGITGSMDVNTSVTFEAPGLEATAFTDLGYGLLAAPHPTVSSVHDVTLTLTNLWGQTIFTKPEYIYVSPPDGITSIVNGQSSNCKLFDLTGRRITLPAKGVTIQGGKKIIR